MNRIAKTWTIRKIKIELLSVIQGDAMLPSMKITIHKGRWNVAFMKSEKIWLGEKNHIRSYMQRRIFLTNYRCLEFSFNIICVALLKSKWNSACSRGFIKPDLIKGFISTGYPTRIRSGLFHHFNNSSVLIHHSNLMSRCKLLMVIHSRAQ